MNKYDYVLFDLDGTLSDSAEGIINGLVYALSKLGVSVSDRNSLRKFIGPPLLPAFAEHLGFDEEKAKTALRLYRESYAVGGIYENKVYPGIPELLKSLSEGGVKLAVATSKPELFSVKIIERYGLSGYFDNVTGCEMDGSHVDKAELIETALKRLGCNAPSRAVMVGDRRYDIIGARKNGLDCIGVLYGYGSREELEGAGASSIVSSVAELGAALA